MRWIKTWPHNAAMLCQLCCSSLTQSPLASMRSNQSKSRPHSVTSTILASELMDHKLTQIKRKLRSAQEAGSAKEVSPSSMSSSSTEGSHQGPVNSGQDRQGGTNTCVTPQDQQRFIHLKFKLRRGCHVRRQERKGLSKH